MSACEVMWLFFVAYIAGEDHILPALALDKPLKTTSEMSFSNKDKAGVGMSFPNIWDGT